MFSVVKYFQQNHFSEINEFTENIFRSLARTKIANGIKRNPATSGHHRRIPANQIPAAVAGIRPVPLDSSNQIPKFGDLQQ
jgi:hypothetical protein